jgi:alginate O-acetyltransferase complex protein AlgF
MRNEKSMRAAFFVVMALCAALPVNAQGHQSVYGPSTPGDSAFVRVLSLLPDPVRVSLGATRIGPVASSAVSSYQPVVPDIYLVRAGGKELEVVPKSGAWLTIACTPKGIILFTDPPHTDPARAQVFLYNLTGFPALDLRTADGKTTLLAGVKSGASAQVVVNALSVSLALYNGSTLVKQVGTLALQRGSSFSVFALGQGAPVSVLTVKADVKAD